MEKLLKLCVRVKQLISGHVESILHFSAVYCKTWLTLNQVHQQRLKSQTMNSVTAFENFLATAEFGENFLGCGCNMKSSMIDIGSTSWVI